MRKVYGVAGAGHGNGARLNLRFAWPSGQWGSLPIAGGLEAAYRRELEASDDPVALRAEIEERLTRVLSPFRTAERFSRRGDHRPARHAADPLRLGGARTRARRARRAQRAGAARRAVCDAPGRGSLVA